jgi:tetratricopeptide (TPR) repeat protein
MLLLKCRLLRQMGFVNKAIALLGDRADYVSEPELKARILFELAGCYVEDERLELARRNLSQVLVLVERGDFSDEAAVELAEVCLKMGQSVQTVELCSKILAFEPGEQIKKRARLLLAEAYKQQKDYDKAALALMDGFQKNIEVKEDDFPIVK